MNRWRTDSWGTTTYPVTTYTCIRCGFRLEHFQTGKGFAPLAKAQGQHEKECWDPDPQCTFVLHPDAVPVLRCKLAAGHPEGPQYDWFTDYNGHVVER